MRLGAYEVERTIGRGGMGVVVRARSATGAVVAIKVLSPGAKPDAHARFEREIRLLAALGDSAGFVPLLDSGLEGSSRFLVMPLVEGGTLRDRLARGPMPVRDAVALARTLAETLGRAHERGLVHRDLKPENILFTHPAESSGGRPLVADLGLAKHFGDGAPGASALLSQTGQMRGTAGYMAPEQMSDAKTAGPAADVFALGAILYECLAGSPAFVGATVLEVVSAVSVGSFTPLGRLRPDAPRALVKLVERALAPDPSARFEDGAALARALAAVGEAKAPAARRWSLLLAVGLAAALALGGALASSMRRDPPPPPPPARELTKAEWARTLSLLAYERVIRGTDGNRARFFATTALELDPRCALALAVRAWLKSVTGDRAGAFEDSTAATVLDPQLAFAWAVRAGAQMVDEASLDRVIADADRAIQLDPRLALGWAYRGAALNNKNDPDAALPALERAIALDPSNGGTYAYRAVAHSKRGSHEAAMEDWGRALALDPTDVEVRATRAMVRSQRNDLEGARRDWDEVIERAPTLAVAWACRAGVRAMARDWAGSLSDSEQAIALDSAMAVARLARGEARENLGDTAGARADYEEFLRMAPSDSNAARARQLLAALQARPGGR